MLELSTQANLQTVEKRNFFYCVAVNFARSWCLSVLLEPLARP
jgi:hypothetical protein